MKKYLKNNTKSAQEYNSEIILKLDRIEAELETIKFAMIKYGNQKLLLDEKIARIEERLNNYILK